MKHLLTRTSLALEVCEEKDACKWSINNGVLTVTGEGTIKTHEVLFGIIVNYPWDEASDKAETLIIESGIKNIPNKAFSNFKVLKNISISDTVKSIHYNAFKDCDAIENIEISPDNQYFMAKDQVIFSRNCKTLIRYLRPSSNHDYSIPQCVRIIDTNAFYSVSALYTIYMPDKLTTIGANAFQSCTSLESITIPSEVTSIPENAFKSCSRLTYITILGTLESISDDAFTECRKLACVNYYGTTSPTFSSNSFTNCTSLSKIRVTESFSGSKFCKFTSVQCLLPLPKKKILTCNFNKAIQKMSIFAISTILN